MKLLLLVLSLLSFLHVARDLLQIKGVKNWFTEFGHIWNKPEYEKYSVVFFFLLGLLFGYLALIWG